MLRIETIATVTKDGTLSVKAPPDVSPGPHRVVIKIDEGLAEVPEPRQLPELAKFRDSLQAAAFEGDFVVKMRDEERL